jgi:hypothetical protein
MNDTRPPTPSTVRSRWTAKDEAALKELQERKRRINEQNREPLEVLVVTTCPGDGTDHGYVIDWLVENATQLRVLLAPFDHEAGA